MSDTADTACAAEEVCGDLIDNTCDGVTDEGCAPSTVEDPGGFSWSCAAVGQPEALGLLAGLGLAAVLRRA
jgi:hypothetical protein